MGARLHKYHGALAPLPLAATPSTNNILLKFPMEKRIERSSFARFATFRIAQCKIPYAPRRHEARCSKYVKSLAFVEIRARLVFSGDSRRRTSEREREVDGWALHWSQICHGPCHSGNSGIQYASEIAASQSDPCQPTLEGGLRNLPGSVWKGNRRALPVTCAPGTSRPDSGMCWDMHLLRANLMAYAPPNRCSLRVDAPPSRAWRSRGSKSTKGVASRNITAPAFGGHPAPCQSPSQSQTYTPHPQHTPPLHEWGTVISVPVCTNTTPSQDFRS
jgi:hypothetical protein